MKVKKLLPAALLVYFMITAACKYIVFPEGLEAADADHEGTEQRVWTAFATNVGKSDAGDLRIEITIRNDTGDWSTMQAIEGKPATLKAKDGKKINCDTVFANTGGHRLAPGFQMRGYTAGKKGELTTQLLYVECKGAETAAGSMLEIEYVCFGGELDDYKPDANQTEGLLEINLDKIAADLTYPIASPVEGLVRNIGDEFVGLSDNVVTLLDTQRTENSFQFKWQNFNPTKFPLKTHIGTPPVIGADGILYGLYEILDMAPVPLTPPSEKVEWTTEVSVPADIKGFYILLSVESKKPRTYLNYVIDISGQ